MEKHETRRKIIRQWTSLPKDKRQTAEQAAEFAKKAIEQDELQPSRSFVRLASWCDIAALGKGGRDLPQGKRAAIWIGTA
jgi:hypothetical protein